MSPGVTFERVYLALKDELGSGRYGAGEHLEPTSLSANLNASITPVRDALHRLVGEGLVEAPRGDGFRTPFLTEIGLRQLYRWHSTLIDLAARSSGSLPELQSIQQSDPVAQIEGVFLAVARRAGNPEHVASVVRLGERLRPVRRVEGNLIPDGEVEIRAIETLLHDGEARALRRSITAYHRRRERIAAEIVERLHRPN